MSTLGRIKHILFGRPIHSKLAHHERLAVLLALPVFASDALSSTAYAGEEILLVLRTGGASSLSLLTPIAVALVLLLWTVVFSYYQTIHAYPQGGGSYRVSSENLGPFWGLMAGGALLIGYVLTVAVSVAAGAAAIIAMLPMLQPYAVLIASASVALIATINLRGARESGLVFAVPTYSFVLLLLVLTGTGAVLAASGHTEPLDNSRLGSGAEGLVGLTYLFFVVKAFVAGCTALTGTEAIADGVLAFKAPEAKNAARTLVLMATLLSILCVGTSWCLQYFHILPMDFSEPGYRPVMAQLAAALFGDNSIFFYLTQAATALILFLAANTGFADFPRLSMFMARDGYLPRQLTSLGDRLVYQNGILTLAVLSVGLLALKNANTHGLIPLYAIGVFLSFTLSQSGMVGWWLKSKRRSWKKWVSFGGAVVTATVTVMLLVGRWSEGAWITLVALALCLAFFLRIKRHYDWLAKKLNVEERDRIPKSKTIVLLLVPRLHKGILEAISYAQALTKDCRAVHVTLDERSAQRIRDDWMRVGTQIPLVILESPFRSLVEPIIEYVDQAIAENPGNTVTVIVPQAIPKFAWQGLLHSNIATVLKKRLASRKNVVITNVRYFLE